jgi:hemerythrin-like metal-binding protein
MGFIEWNVNFYTGLPEVDQQHNKLVALANRLSEMPEEDAAVLDQAFQELKDYIVEHFTLEERLMEEARIDVVHFRYHKNAHALFVAKIAALWDERDSGTGQTLPEMLDFLKSWIMQHILQTDRKMAHEVHDKMGTSAPHNMFTHF